jgi:hypothetical protein
MPPAIRNEDRRHRLAVAVLIVALGLRRIGLGRAALACIFLVVLATERATEWLRDIGYRIGGRKPPPVVWRAPIRAVRTT